ncbi:ankyrin repeat domain-containing protein [Oscillatoria laete-virens NRMC-F 0139]|nr:ankyrin repeat domain-containing protein [Oscillatoria laete-virens]MDL5055556.1 ankyrin repeat domain-containing protein [Oscillatoria laete-virens NRMC-F 0139]
MRAFFGLGKFFRERKILAVILVFLVCFLGYRIFLKAAIAVKLNSIRAEGLPTNRAEWNQWRGGEPPAEQNAANIFSRAYELIDLNDQETLNKTFVFKTDEGNDPSVPYDAETISALKMIVEGNREALALLDEGAKLNQAFVPIAELWNPIWPWRKGSILLLVSSELSIAEKDALGYLNSSINILQKLVLVLDSRPLTLSYFLKLRTEREAIQSVERALNRISFDDDELIQLQKNDWPINMARSYEGERAIWLDEIRQPLGVYMQNLKDDYKGWGAKMPWFNNDYLMRVYDWIGLRDLFTLWGLHRFDRIIEIAKMPLPQRLELVLSEKDEGRTMGIFTPYMINISILHDGRYTFYRATEPVILGARANTFRECAQIAIAIKRYQLAHGKLPDSLAQLVPAFIPEIPTDPFNRKPLQYGEENGGFYVYSVGPDLTDDGGKERNEKGETIFDYHPGRNPLTGLDIVFRVGGKRNNVEKTKNEKVENKEISMDSPTTPLPLVIYVPLAWSSYQQSLPPILIDSGKTNSSQSVTLSYKDEDFVNALRGLARRADINLIITPGIKGKITLYGRYAGYTEALKAVIQDSDHKLVPNAVLNVWFVYTKEYVMENLSYTPLQLAVQNGEIKKVKTLLGEGADIKMRDAAGNNLLHLALQKSCSKEMVELLIDRGVPLHEMNDQGLSPLHLAAQARSLENIALLLDKGVAVDSKTPDQLTPLYFAVKSGYVSGVDYFLKRGANPDGIDLPNPKNKTVSARLENSSGEETIHFAKENMSSVLLNLARRSGINMLFIGNGETTVSLTAASPQEAIQKIISDYGLSWSWNQDKNTLSLTDSTQLAHGAPLIMAVNDGNIGIARKLLEKGASVEVHDQKGNTPLQIAQKRQNAKLVKLLKSFSEKE